MDEAEVVLVHDLRAAARAVLAAAVARRQGLRGRGEGGVLRGRARAACVDQSACCDLISSILAGGL